MENFVTTKSSTIMKMPKEYQSKYLFMDIMFLGFRFEKSKSLKKIPLYFSLKNQILKNNEQKNFADLKIRSFFEGKRKFKTNRKSLA